MARLEWVVDYNAGVDRGVVYSADGYATAWNGLSTVEESPSDLRTIITYRDGIKIVNVRADDSYSASIQCFSYPEALSGAREVNLSFRTGSKIHLVYNATALIGSRSFTQQDAAGFSFDISTRPVAIPGARPSAHLVIDTAAAWLASAGALEDILYGTDTEEARMPTAAEVLEIFEQNALLRVVDHGDGSFTVTAPDAAISMLDPHSFEITWPSAIFLGTDEYKISSY
jgi:hypothetical protein